MHIPGGRRSHGAAAHFGVSRGVWRSVELCKIEMGSIVPILDGALESRTHHQFDQEGS